MTETQTLDKDAFMRLVTQEHLQVEGPTGGYLYAGKQGRDGWELYRTPNNPWWLVQGDYTVTQNAVGGGALHIVLTCPTATVAKVLRIYATGTASATTLIARVYNDAAQITQRLFELGAGASREAGIPATGTAVPVHQSIGNSTDLKIGPGELIDIYSAAALQTETLRVRFAALLSTDSTLTVATTGSAGTPALAANAIGAANQKQLVVLT